MLGYKYKNIVADAGYESEENYVFIELNGQDAYIKPVNYEISKTKKYRTDIGKFENMVYDPSRDTSCIPLELFKDAAFPIVSILSFECSDLSRVQLP